MKCVILESPYRANINLKTDKQGIEGAIDIYEAKALQKEFKQYAQRCMLDCLKRGESPNVSHLLFTQVLDDNNHEMRNLGIKAGFAWHQWASYMVVYTDYGITDGMHQGISH